MRQHYQNQLFSFITFALLTLISVSSFTATAQATINPSGNNIIYVNTAVIGGTGDGSSWENAVPELADALKYARTEYNADNTIYDTTPLQIYVAIGTYKPLYHAANGSYTTNGSRDNSFVMVKNVQIYGGFDPVNNITDLTHNRILPNNNATVGTILSGDIDTTNDNTDNKAYHVVISSGNVGSALLNGVTITQGNANGTNITITVNGNAVRRDSGGGMANFSSSPVLTHVNITNNTASFGGGMDNNSSSPVLTNINITNNTAIQGGGMYNYYSSSPVLTNVNITDNTAVIFGGGMYNSISSSSPQVYNSIVYGNTASTGDNVYNNNNNNNNSTPQFYNSLIEGSGGSTAWDTTFGTDGGNNLDATTSPFTDAANGDYSLAPGSPAIDAGNNQYWINQMGPITGDETDLAGNPRIIGSSIDMGVYEYQPIQITPDTNSIIYVNTAVIGGTGDGSSWANAITELADALKYARTEYNADNTIYDTTPLQIYVAKGTYKPLYNAANGSYAIDGGRDNAFVMVKNVQIYGGFDPVNNITDLTHNRILPDNNATVGTILSGDIGTLNDNTDNAYHVIISSGNVGNALLNGVTITQGNANVVGSIRVNGNAVRRDTGGGMCNISSSPVLTHVNITNNTASFGGGMDNESSSPVLTNINITNNTAIQGGGMYSYSYSSPILTNVNITNNTANINGGGMYSYSYSSPILTNVNITNNTANSGGGMRNDRNSSPQVYNSIVYGNMKNNGNADNFYNNNNSTPQFYNSLIEGSGGSTAWVATFGTNGGNNIVAVTSPFTDAANGDYSLAPGSPAIDAGNNQYWINQMGPITGNETDFAGNPRIIGSSIDMGAYEDQTIPIIPDANNILYVNTAVIGGTGDGSSWENAVPELADALKWADLNQDDFISTPLKIWVAGGTYNPIYKISGLDEFNNPTTVNDKAFLLVNNVNLFGGFAGNETDIAQRDLSLTSNNSILSGDLGVDGKTFHVLVAVGESNNILNTEINGFTIQEADSNNDINTVLVNNQNISRNYGAGLYLVNSNTILKNLTISDNKSEYGAGIYSTNSTSELTNIIIKNNFASYDGGGIFNSSSISKLTNVLINNNTATEGGGMRNEDSTLDFRNVTIANNVATGGSELFLKNSSGAIYNSIIFGNDIDQIYNNNSDIDFNNNLIKGSIFEYIWGTDNNNFITNTSPFTDIANNDYTLNNTSEAINKGDNQFWQGTLDNLTLDLANNPRLVSCAIDLGAYEQQSILNTPAPTADNQSFCISEEKTIADLVAAGTDIKWYASATSNDVLDVTDVLTSGSYFASQTLNSCESVDRIEVLVTISNILHTTSQVDILCNGANTGLASVTVSGGVTPYTYTWDNGITSTTNEATDLSAGTYTITIEDANGCSTTEIFTITEPTALDVVPTQTNILCNGANTGLASVTVSGGVTPYTYTWDNGITSTTNEATDLPAGTYTVTIGDANGCFITETFTITEPPALSVVPTQVDVLCNGANTGLASVTVSGGVTPYTYTWDNGITSTTHEATDLSAGTYTITIEDANGCSTTEIFTITEPTALDVVPTQTNILCNGANTGLASVTVSGGVTPYTYTWDNGITSTTNEATDLPAGTYTVTIGDANGCFITETFTITEPPALSVVPTQVDVLCNGANTGLASVTVSGGVAPYTYTWDNGITSTTNEATDLPAGTYTVTIEDANGCITTETFTITEPTTLDVVPTQVDILCNSAATGLASVTVSGGVAPYTYTWDNGITSTTDEATNLSAGTYTVTIEDANGCITTETFAITEPIALDVVPTQVDVLCNSAATGLASVIVSGGVAPYTYTWDNGITSTTNEATDLSAGTYTVTIEDTNGCSTTETFTITEPTALDVAQTQTNVLCKGAATGSASVTVSGGVAPYTYTWDNGITSTTHEATDLSAGIYTVTIEDANGCITTEIFTITEPAIIPTPVVTTPVSYTYGDTALALDALANNSNTLLWYDAATGGLGSTNAFIPTTDTIGTQTYWVSQLTADGCESERVAIEVNVSPAILIVMADENQTKVYGSADPVFTYTATGFQFNDNDNVFTGLLSRDPGENVGTYPIHQGSLSAGPAYTITFVEATFNITAAELIVTPNNGQTKVYGSADPVYQYTVSGFVAGDSFSVISGLLGRLPGENVGNYLYHSGTLTSVHNNYTFTVLPEYFIITPAPIDVVVNPGQHKMYGTSDPFFNYSALGLVNGDSPYTAFTGVLQRSMGENVGIYAINQGTLQTNANYQLISFTAADFEIVPALIANLQLNDATYVYDGTPKSLVVTGPVDPNAQITYTGNNQINAGTYTVTATVDYGSNYQQLVLTATLTIVRANQTIFFEIDSPVILEDTPPFNLQATATSGLPVHYTYTYSGIQPAEVSASGAVELLAPGEVHITAHQDGDNNYNAAVPVTRTLVIESRDNGIWDLYIDDEHFAQPADEIFVIKGCDDTNSASVEIRVETQIGATVSPSPIIIVPTPDYGIYEVEIVVTSQNGQHTKTYKVVIDKRLPWENILMQKYDNVVFINNNPATNGGYKFVRYEWYKNDVKVADQQLFSEGATMHDLIDLSASYHAVLYTDDGKVLTTCSMTIIHKHDYSLTVYPNPVDENGVLNIKYDAPNDTFTGGDYLIFTAAGQLVKKGKIEQSFSQINLMGSLQSGAYIMAIKINGKNKSVRFIIK